jgi:hypothetical protein
VADPFASEEAAVVSAEEVEFPVVAEVVIGTCG